MSEWMKGLIAGVIATLIGFGLTVVWDLHKSRQDANQRDEATVAAVNEELTANLSILKVNQDQIDQELKVLGNNQHIVVPLNPLQTGSWDLIKIRVPMRLVQEGSILKQVREVSQLTNEVNEIIRSRENFQIHNGAMSNYTSTLEIYDKILQTKLGKLSSALEKLKPSLQ